MVAPFKPYVRESTTSMLVQLPHGGWIRVTDTYIRRTGVTQKPPYVDTPYETVIYKHLNGVDNVFRGWDTTSRDLQFAINSARAKFVGALGDSSSFGATFTAERKSTWDTVLGGVSAALRSARAVSRGRLGEAAKILGFHPPVEVVKTRHRRKKGKSFTTRREHWRMPSGKLVAKSAANKWLWWSYGVKPLVGDLYNGMDILVRDAPWHRVHGYGSARSETRGSGPQKDYDKTLSSCAISADVRVANPNLWLANQLGLINPVQWINEAIPFSFVVDWFSNLSQVISQMTDFVGLEIAKPLTTTKSVCSHTTYDDYFGSCTSNSTFYVRTLEIPKAKLLFKYEKFNWQRGANAVSLLVGMLRNTKR